MCAKRSKTAAAPASLAEAAEEISSNRETTERLILHFGEVSLDVRSDSAALVRDLRRYFGSFVGQGEGSGPAVTALEMEPPRIRAPLRIKPPDPGKSKIKEEFLDLPGGRIVRKRLTGMVFLFGPGLNLAAGPCLANSNQVVNFINNRYIQDRLNAGCLLGHAAAVRRGGRGLAIAGFSGAGKSTLALRMMERGAYFVSNDRLLVERCEKGLSMGGVAKLPRVNPGTLLADERLSRLLCEDERERFAALPDAELWELEHKFDVPIDEVYGPGRFSLSSPFDGLAVLNWKRGRKEGFCIKKVDLEKRRDLLRNFIKPPGLFYEPDGIRPETAFSEEAYLDLLRECPCFEISGGVDFEGAAEELTRRLDERVCEEEPW